MAISTLKSRETLIGISAICGAIILIEYYFNVPMLTGLSSELKSWTLVISSFALGSGYIRQIWRAVVKVQARKKNWQISLYGVLITLIMSFFGLAYGTKSIGYDWMFNYLLTPVRMTSLAITAFFIFSAGFRAFRIRNVDASIFLTAGLLMLFARAPIGEVIWSQFPVIGTWILDIPSNSVSRALLITEAIGLTGYSLRYLLGLERIGVGEVD